ncbi:MAG: AAC(3) family N-acetyltransferase [Deltaproteobacteria bacterium]|nr:AAC(3) family N-acetyltransferase [Deltaproteobacteria bacterium]
MHTETSLYTDLQRLGVPRGGVVIVHSGYRSLGPVEGGPAAVARALLRAVGDGGTLLVPTFTTNLIDPYTWPEPPSAEERARIMEEMPAFDPEQSAPHKMGAITLALWRLPGARRSVHPVSSWAAVGPRAEELTVDHPREDPEGIDGPVGRACRADAWVVLIGVDHDANTSIHLAESLLEMPHLEALPDRYLVVTPEGGREWRPVAKTTKCSDGFVKLEAYLARAGVIRGGTVGDAPAQLLRARDIVRVVAEVVTRDPPALLCDDPECVHCPTSRALLRSWTPPADWRARLP